MRQAPESGPYTTRSIHALLLGSVLAASLATLSCPAEAARSPQKATTAGSHQAGPRVSAAVRGEAYAKIETRAEHLGAGSKLGKNAKAHYAPRYAALQCVPFARAASGIELKGNAVNWWDAAAGVYERGNRPEAGAVLNFRANGSMRLGHVAVVERVISSREIEIDHANWAWSGKGNVSRGVAVIDVSDHNDWSAVRVALGRGDEFGSIYSTYGFIYDRPDQGTMVANTQRGLTPPPRDVSGYDEVAEAPAGRATIAYDAPARSLR